MNARFEEIQNSAIRDAEKIGCSTTTFHRGLVAMYLVLKERIECENIDPTDPDLLDDDDGEEVDDD